MLPQYMQDERDLIHCQGTSARHLIVQLRGLLLSALRTQIKKKKFRNKFLYHKYHMFPVE